MGEAKRRGTPEERKAQALERDKPSKYLQEKVQKKIFKQRKRAARRRANILAQRGHIRKLMEDE